MSHFLYFLYDSPWYPSNPRFLQFSFDSAASFGIKLLDLRFLPSRNNSSFAPKATCSEGLTKLTFNLLLPPLPSPTWSLFSFETACYCFSVWMHSPSSSSSGPDNSGGSYSFEILSNKNFIDGRYPRFLVFVVVKEFQVGNRGFHRQENRVLSHDMKPQHSINENVRQRFWTVGW